MSSYKLCPKCKANRVRLTRSRKRKRDGRRVREYVCLHCGHDFTDAPRLRAPVRGKPKGYDE